MRNNSSKFHIERDTKGSGYKDRRAVPPNICATPLLINDQHAMQQPDWTGTSQPIRGTALSSGKAVCVGNSIAWISCSRKKEARHSSNKPQSVGQLSANLKHNNETARRKSARLTASWLSSGGSVSVSASGAALKPHQRQLPQCGLVLQQRGPKQRRSRPPLRHHRKSR